MNTPRRIKLITPVPVPPAAVALFEAQLPVAMRRPQTTVDFCFAREGGAFLDSYYDEVLASAFILEAAETAEDEGYSAVCINSMTDTGLDGVRSRLTIPVVGAGQSSFLLACNIGASFSVVTLWDRWIPSYKKILQRHGLMGRVASIRHINIHPNLEELLHGKEEVVFDALEKAARAAIEQDGAEVIVLGSTTMYQSHHYLAERLPVPVINPALVVYQACEHLLDLSLSHSKLSYPAPEVLNDGLFKPVPGRF